VIPTKKSMIVSTEVDNQPAISIRIFEGERPMAKDNHYLGEFSLGGIAPAPKGQPQIEVTFDLDSNGILSAGAEDKGTGKSEKITITNDKGRLTEEQIEKMIEDAESFADSDDSARARVNTKSIYENYLHTLRLAAEGSGEASSLGEKLHIDDKERIMDIVTDGMSWLYSNPEVSAEEVSNKTKEVKDLCAPIIAKYYGSDAKDDDYHDGMEEEVAMGRLSKMMLNSISEEL